MWCTWCFRQRTCGLVNWRDSEAAIGYRLSAVGSPMAAGTVFPKVDTPYGQALTGLRVDGPLGRRFLRGLSLTRLWREGCGRAPLNYRRRPLMKKPSQPPWRASENRPTALVGEGDSPFGGWRHHLARWEACHWIRGSRGSPMNPVPLPPPQFGGAAKGKRLNGQARRLTSPHLEVLCRTSTVAL